MIGLALAAMACAVGCTAGPSPPGQATVQPEAALPSATSPAGLPGAMNDVAPVAAKTQSQAMQEVMAELQQLGLLDPAAQRRLMEDLRRTDPSLWPMISRQFQAAMAHRHRAESRQTWAGEPGLPAAGFEPGPESAAIRRQAASATAWATDPLRPGGGSVGGPTYGPAPEPRAIPRKPDAQPDCSAARPPGRGPALARASQSPPGARQRAEGRAAGPEQGRVVNVSHSCPAAAEWQEHLASAIRALESENARQEAAADQVASQMRLRMLYLMAGRPAKALRPIPSLSPSLQEFWAQELFALGKWLQTEGTADTAARAAETKQILTEAVSRLGEAAPLVVRNLAFCTKIHSYGCIERFPKYEFVPEQEVLIYAEVENFTSEPTPNGFHTVLRSSCQIFDAAGRRVADHDFTTTEEYCRNFRRDFFIGYHLRLPKRIYAGKHTLKLTIRDLKAQKVGQASIELTIVEPDD